MISQIKFDLQKWRLVGEPPFLQVKLDLSMGAYTLR